MHPDHKTFSKQDVARLLKAQTYENKYYPRSWVPGALGAGWSPDDICHIIATSCDLLSRMYRDLECDDLLRLCCRQECEDRRKYRLPASGCEYISEDYKPKEKRKKRSFSDNQFFDDTEKTEGKFISFSDLMYRNTANRISVFDHLERIGRNMAIAGQSERLAQRLEKMGIDAYRKLQGCFVKRGLLTGLVAPVSQQFRNILFIPSVAVSNRANLKKELKFFVDNELDHPEHLRFVVITGGRNVPFHGALREAHKRNCRKISEAFKYLEKKYGAEIYFRGTEETINNTSRSVNIHYNVLYKLPFIRPEDGGKGAFINDLRRLVGCMVQDQGELRNLDEVVKYVCKPNDIESLEDDVLLWFYDELTNSRQFQSYGGFQAFRSNLKDSRKRVVFDNSTRKLRLMNKRKISDEDIWEASSDKESYQAKPLSEQFDSEVFASFLAEKNMLHSDFMGMGSDDFQSTEFMEENKIVGVMLPHCAFLNVSEPCLLVRNYTEQPQTELGEKAFQLIEKFSKQIREGVHDKLELLGSKSLLVGDFKAIREFFASGNKDVDQLDSYKLDKLHDISRHHPPPPRWKPKPYPAPDNSEQWEKGFRAPVQA